MCNLYRMTDARAEVASLFGAVELGASNAGAEVYPGYPGLVVANGELRSMTWGFPLRLKDARPGSKPKPVNNARADRLDSFLWRYSFAERRCLIPLSAFAEAEGPKGGKTRTWFSLPGEPVFAVAGIWRDTAEWGPAYSMVMTEACVHLAGVHDRMPVILAAGEREAWVAGSAADALALCRPWGGAMTVDRTPEPWVRRAPAAGS